MAAGNRFDFRPYLTQEPLILAALSALAVVFFLAVGGLSHLYHTQQQSLGERWFNRGTEDLKAQRFATAAVEFRAALLYSRDNYSYQLNLAQALLGEKRTSEANAYLVNLWDEEPENGVVNLELARIEADTGDREQAVRYYNNAIYATWPGDDETGRRDARLELIEYLLKINERAQAQSELMALAANLGDQPAEQERIGELFLKTKDYEHALAAYRLSVSANPHNAAALSGAGFAAFQLGRYPVARRYLQDAVTENPNDAQSAARLSTSELVLQMDPFQRQLSVAQRDRMVVEDFAVADERLKSCGSQAGFVSGQASQSGLQERWKGMKPRVTLPGLRQNPDVVEQAMDLAFDVERQTSIACTPPTGKDLALLLIAKMHEGN